MKIKRKTVACLAGVLCFLLMGAGLAQKLEDQEKAIPDNPIVGINGDTSQVLWTGTGFYSEDLKQDQGKGKKKIISRVLETETEPETETETERWTEQITEVETEVITELVTELETELLPAEENGPADPGEEDRQTDGEKGSENNKDGQNSQDNTQTIKYSEETVPDEVEDIPSEDDDENQEGADVPREDPEEGKYPVIASDLTDGETVGGSYRTFYVRAVDYRGSYISSGSLAVTGNGERLYASADDGDVVRYRMDLTDGGNTVVIQAVDQDGRKTAVSYTIYRGEDQEQVPAGTVTFSLEATTVGLGCLIGPAQEYFYEGEQLSYVIDRVLQNHGYTYRYDGSLTSGFYLKHVISPGITNGCSIPPELEQKLSDANCPRKEYHTDSLGEFDFTNNSGWMYQVNGVYMNSGISTYYPADGDVVRIRFSLYGGADVGGMQQEAWGDW